MDKRLKKLLPPLIIILVCVIIIFIGGPKPKKNTDSVLTPLVFQNKETGLYGAVDYDRHLIVNAEYKTLSSKKLDGEYYFIGTSKNNETVIMSDEGHVLDTVPSTYCNVSVLSLQDKLLKVSCSNYSNKNLVGVLNFSNKVIIPVKYDSLAFKNNFLLLNPLGNESIANTNGKLLVSSNDYISANIEGNGIVVQNSKGLYGLLDFNGNQVLKPIYTNIHGVYENTFAVANKDNLYAVYDLADNSFNSYFEYISIQQNASTTPFLACKLSNGVALYGYIDGRNSTIIPFEFKSAYGFNGNDAIVQKHDKFGLINKTGGFIIDPDYSIIPGYAYAIESFEDSNYYVGYKDNNSVIMNSEGTVLASVPGIVQTISNSTVFYQDSNSKDFLYNLNTKKTTAVKLYLEPLTKGTLTPKGYFGAYKSVLDSKYANSLYLYEENKGIISVDGYNSIKFENGLFLCHSETRYDILKPNGKVLMSFNPVNILNITVTPDKIIYVQKLNPSIGNRMHSTVAQQENTRLIYAYNFNGKEISLKTMDQKK